MKHGVTGTAGETPRGKTVVSHILPAAAAP
jgi:hypothetical protein